MFNGKIDYKWLFSIAMLVYQRVAVVEDHRQEKLLFFICTVRRIGFSQFPDSNPLHLCLPKRYSVQDVEAEMGVPLNHPF